MYIYYTELLHYPKSLFTSRCHIIWVTWNNSLRAVAIERLLSSLLSQIGSVTETISKLLCTVQNRQNKTVILEDTQIEMSQTWAMTYCEWTKKIVKSLAEPTWVYNGENTVLALGPTQGMCKVVLQRRPKFRLNDCLSNFRTIWYT